MLTKLTLCLAAIGTAGTLSLTALAQDPPPPPKVVLGTFDSRVLAMAYYRSAQFAEQLNEVRVLHEAAKSAGDDAECTRLEESMGALQEEIHAQGFSTAPVDNILAEIDEQIAEVAAAHGVQVVVSRWQIAHQVKDARTVDLSFALGELFEPSEETRKIMLDVYENPPTPIDELQHEH